MKIGIFGGTFDPPHIGHINACKSFIKKIDLDQIYVIPVFLPPHKCISSNVSAENRLEMTKIAFSNLSNRVVVSDMEIKRKGKSYTAETIRYFKDNGYDDIYFLCGTDMILSMDTWYKPEYIFKNSKIVYARRENDEENSILIDQKCREYREKYEAQIILLELDVIEVSSSEIREAISCKEKLQNFVSKDIYEYITKNKLYV